MVRITAGVVAGFVAWMVAWFGGEALLSALFPAGYGVHQRAFEEALIEGHGGFVADTTMSLVHIVLGAVVSVLAGFLAARVAGEGRRAPMVLGCLLLALGVAKAVMSWPYVPLWYHVVFTAMLLPLAIVGGRLGRAR